MTDLTNFSILSDSLLIGIYKTTDGIPAYHPHFTREYMLEQLNKRYNKPEGREWAKTKFLAIGD